MVLNVVRILLFVALSSWSIALVGCNKAPEPGPATPSAEADAREPVSTSAEPDVPGPRGVLWEIGKPDAESAFDTHPHDDPEVVEFEIGDPENRFPEGLGTDIGKQRSKIRIHFAGVIPTGTKLHVQWSPGGSEAVDQFKVELDGKPLGESPALQGTDPAVLRTDSFKVPASKATDHVLVFSHPQGDGLGLRHIRLEADGPPANLDAMPQPALGTGAIVDPVSNLTGDTTRTFMDIVEATVRSDGDNSVFEVLTAAPFPASAEMTDGKRFDFIFFIDIDKNRSTGQGDGGNDYNIHVFLKESGWGGAWYKVSSIAEKDGIAIDHEKFKVHVDGRRVSYTFPKQYLPSKSFEMWVTCFSGDKWPPRTGNPATQRAVFDL